MVEVYAIKLLSETDYQSTKDLILTLLPEEVGRKVNKFVRPIDAQRSLLGELLARYLIVARLRNENMGIKQFKDIRFIYGEKGKPYPEGLSNIHFNISHAGDWVICGISSKPIGVDVEKITKGREKIARRYFTPEEYQFITNHPVEKQTETFFELWTLKESYLKAMGRGLTMALNSFSVVKTDDSYRIIINGDYTPHQLELRYLENNYKVAVCALESRIEKKIIVLNKQILKFYTK